MKKVLVSTILRAIILLSLICISISAKTHTKDTFFGTQPLQQCWAYNSQNYSQPNLASDNESIFISHLSGEIKSIDSKNGTILWNTDFGGEIYSKILVDEINIYLLIKTEDNNSDVQSTLRAINVKSGITSWQTTINNPKEQIEILLEKKQIILVRENSNIIAIDSQNGNIDWEQNLKSNVSTIYISNSIIILGTEDKRLILISDTKETAQTEIKTGTVPTNILFASKEKIFWADDKDKLYASNISTGKQIWANRFGAEITSIVGTPQGLIISSLDNFIYLIKEDKGRVIWKKRLAARIIGKPFVKDNIIFVSAFGDTTALLLKLEDGKVINTLSLSDANYFVGNPFFVSDFLIFPTLKGLYAFSSECPKNKKTGL